MFQTKTRETSDEEKTLEHSHIDHRIESSGHIKPLRYASRPDMTSLTRYDDRYENAGMLSFKYQKNATRPISQNKTKRKILHLPHKFLTLSHNNHIICSHLANLISRAAADFAQNYTTSHSIVCICVSYPPDKVTGLLQYSGWNAYFRLSDGSYTIPTNASKMRSGPTSRQILQYSSRLLSSRNMPFASVFLFYLTTLKL